MMETQVWCRHSASVWGGSLRKGTMASASTFIWKKAAPQALTLMPDNSVPPWLSLVLLSCCPSAGLRVGESVPEPCKRNCLGLHQPSDCTASVPAVFNSQKLWGLTFLALEPWTTGPGICYSDPLLLRETSNTKIPLPIFTHHTGVWDQPVLRLHPSYKSQCGFLFNSLGVGLPFS